MTNKEQTPETDGRLWINPTAGMVAHHKVGSAFHLYARVHPDDVRVEEIRRNRRDWYGGMGQITEDIDYLLSLLPQLSSSERKAK